MIRSRRKLRVGAYTPPQPLGAATLRVARRSSPSPKTSEKGHNPPVQVRVAAPTLNTHFGTRARPVHQGRDEEGVALSVGYMSTKIDTYIQKATIGFGL